MFNHLARSLRPQVSGMTDPSQCYPEGYQDAVSVVERLPERPIVPTSASDWEAKKQIIRELYMDQNMILNEVIDIMILKYKFKAT